MSKKKVYEPKCWDCAYLAKCLVNVPCSKFKKYDYNDELSPDDAAKILGVSVRTYNRYKKIARAWLEKEIQRRTGIQYHFVFNGSVERLERVEKI